MNHDQNVQDNQFDIAIIGMSGRFPGANNINVFWDNLIAGKESITFFSDEELISSGVDSQLLSNPNYIKAAPVIDDAEMFDNSFFGYSPREAQFMDPQQRLFLECSWGALENAGYNAEKYNGRISVYGGSAMNTYLLFSGLLPNFSTEYLPTLIGSDKDFIATRVAYKLNLKGPCVTVQTACSTSLVAVHLACQSLLNEECDMALAGGVSIRVPLKSGYLYQEGSVFTPDGHCRPFDASAKGTIFGSGAGIVVLKRLNEAIKDRDNIYAVIKGSAANNDGASKIDYTAPSVSTQSEVILEALSNAGVSADTISYVEAHGTGTYLGDPIEIAALSKAFYVDTNKKQYCAVGSVKSNIGHLDAAAGIAGLIKTALSLKNKMIPPSLHFDKPNPEIDFENSPFYVNDKLNQWKTNGSPRRAGLSSLGIGGTNAHIILEEAPIVKISETSRTNKLLLYSAKSDKALKKIASDLADHLEQTPQKNLADVAFTLQHKFHSFSYSQSVICTDHQEAIKKLREKSSRPSSKREIKNRDIVFMFPGSGAQYPNLGLDLYHNEPVYRRYVDQCLELLQVHCNLNLKDLIYPSEDQLEKAAKIIQKPSLGSPALFITEYAIAQLWREWGIQPVAMIGHSLGEYAAACLAEVVSLEDALKMVTYRGQLFETLPEGAMTSVNLSESEVRKYTSDDVSLAGVNAPSLCILSGPVNAIEGLEKLLVKDGVEYRRIKAKFAAHSKMLDPILNRFEEFISKIKFNKPSLPYFSSTTGSLITEQEITNPQYWVRNIRETVRFNDGLKDLLQEPDRIFLETGPGNTLSTLARLNPHKGTSHTIIPSMRHPREMVSDDSYLLTTLGELLQKGVNIDWDAFYANETRRKVDLPTYPFERKPHWIKAGKNVGKDGSNGALLKSNDVSNWFYVPSWKKTAPIQLNNNRRNDNEKWLIFLDTTGFGLQLIKKLREQNKEIITVSHGNQFSKGKNEYIINPTKPGDYNALFSELASDEKNKINIVHLWNVTLDSDSLTKVDDFNKAQDIGFYSLLNITKSLGKYNAKDSIHLWVISNSIQIVNGTETLNPNKATVLGPCKVIPQEYPNITCKSIDIVLPKPDTKEESLLANQLINEFNATQKDLTIAYRNNFRWVQTFEPLNPNGNHRSAELSNKKLVNNGTYLITGGLGEIGFEIARHLATTINANIVLTGRTSLPDKNDWDKYLNIHQEKDIICDRIEKLRILEKMGAQVLVLNADVANEDQMIGAIEETERRFGKLNGVIHTAGIVDPQALKTIQDTNPVDCDLHFIPKIRGLYVLVKALQDKPLDFCLLFSSVSAFLGGIGHTAYTTANIFMDVFANQLNQKGQYQWLSVDWDIWKLNNKFSFEGTSLEGFGINQQQGMEAFNRIVSLEMIPQVIVSTGNLEERLDQWSNINNGRFDDEDLNDDTLDENAILGNETEKIIVKIWQDRLGVDQVGLYDNFYELGGHSLLATQIVSRIREVLNKEMSVADILNAPTVSQLAALIEERANDKPEGQELTIKPVSRSSFQVKNT